MFETVPGFIRCATNRKLEYRGFEPADGAAVCIHCGRTPDSTHRLHVVLDLDDRKCYQYGSFCYPQHFVSALEGALVAELDAVRQHNLQINWNRLSMGRCCLASAPLSCDGESLVLSADQCVLNGYRFALQAVGKRTFTIRVYDKELPILGRFMLLHYYGKTEAEVVRTESAELAQNGEVALLGLKSDAQESHDHGSYWMIRFPLGYLANKFIENA